MEDHRTASRRASVVLTPALKVDSCESQGGALFPARPADRGETAAEHHDNAAASELRSERYLRFSIFVTVI
jgi:hypothetical protein